MKRGVGFFVTFGLVSVLWWSTQQATESIQSKFVFEFAKQDVTSFKVHYPAKTDLEIEEVDGEWILSDSGYSASMTMVNRVRHQLHQLPVRAVVTNHNPDLSVYGLGTEATLVSVQLRSGAVSFEVGDPNPTGVSYYIRPLTGPLANQVLTVAKAAVDYFDADRSEFRSPHFCRFDLDAVTGIQIEHPLEESWSLRKEVHDSTEQWIALHPDGTRIAASKDVVHRILGRFLALKSSEYIGQIDPRWTDLETTPITVTLSRVQEPELTIRIGSMDRDGQSLFWLNNASEAALARNGVLSDLRFQANKVRDPMVLSGWLTNSMQMSLQGDGIFTGSIRRSTSDWILNDALLPEDKIQEVLSTLEGVRGFFTEEDERLDRIVGQLRFANDSEKLELSVGSVQTHAEINDAQPLETQQYRRASLQYTSGETIYFRVEEIWVQQVVRLFSP